MEVVVSVCVQDVFVACDSCVCEFEVGGAFCGPRGVGSFGEGGGSSGERGGRGGRFDRGGGSGVGDMVECNLCEVVAEVVERV